MNYSAQCMRSVKFLNTGYISALTQASVLIRKKCSSVIKVLAKDTNNISYTVRYGWENTQG